MSDETLSFLMEMLFTIAAITGAFVQLARHRTVPAVEVAPASTWAELLLMAFALLVAAIGPNILVVATTPGMPEMPVLTRYALLPSLALLVTVVGAAMRLGQKRLLNRIGVGLWIGAAASGFLDAIRLVGFHLGWMPGNMPRMFGVMILDQMALGPSPGSDLIGYLYHYWVGACFGLTYTLLAGRVRWWGGLIWGLIIEVGMMVTPPMVVAMDTGYFGLKFGPGLLATSLTAHIALGLVMGLLAERYVRHKGSVFLLLRTCWGASCAT